MAAISPSLNVLTCEGVMKNSGITRPLSPFCMIVIQAEKVNGINNSHRKLQGNMSHDSVSTVPADSDCLEKMILMD